MRVLLSTFGSRGDVQPMLALATALRSLGADARVCAPADEEFVDLFAAADVPLLPAFRSVREFVKEMIPKRATLSLPKVAGEVMAAQYAAIDAAVAAFDGDCDLMLTTGLFSSVAAAKTVADKRGLRYELAAYCPMFLPSPHQRPFEFPSHPHPPGLSNAALWERNVQVMDDIFGGGFNAMRHAVGLPRIADIYGHCHPHRMWLAADPVIAPCPQTMHDIVQTGAWLPVDERPLPVDLLEFLEAGAPPVYVGLGSLNAP